MQVTSMLSAGYLEPVQNVTRVQNVNREADIAKQQKEREILAEEESLKAKLGNATEVHTVYHYSMGSDGRRYITGASVTMRGSEDDLNRVNGGITTQDLLNGPDEKDKADGKGFDSISERIQAQNSQESADRAERNNEEKEEEQIRELEQTQREVVAHELAHQAAAGEFGGGISYTYTQGPDGKNYITGGEVPIQLRQGSTPEETLHNMQQVQRAANAPADPSDQDRSVAAKAASIASKARREISQDNGSEEGSLTATVARGTPVIGANSNEQDQQDPNMNGVSSLLASIREYQIQSQIMPAA